MTQPEILEKAIEKAVASGWDNAGLPAEAWNNLGSLDRRIIVEKVFLNPEAPGAYFMLIFSHDFAKALWGEVMVSTNTYWFSEGGHKNELHLPLWKHNLREMVLSEDPLKFLGENLERGVGE